MLPPADTSASLCGDWRPLLADNARSWIHEHIDVSRPGWTQYHEWIRPHAQFGPQHFLGCKQEPALCRLELWICKRMRTKHAANSEFVVRPDLTCPWRRWYTVEFRNQMEGLQLAAQVRSRPQERRAPRFEADFDLRHVNNNLNDLPVLQL